MKNFIDRKDHDNDLNKGLNDCHCEPEGKIGDVKGYGATAGKDVANTVAWVANLDNEGDYTPSDTDNCEDDGGIADMRGEEDVAVE